MEYTKKEMDNYNLYFVKTNKFKTIHVSFNFGKERTKEDEVYGVILFKVLLNGTNDYPDLDDLCRKRMSIYNPSVRMGSETTGLDRIIYLDTVFADEKYTEKGMNRESIEFALSHIYNPLVKDGAFEEKSFELAKHDYIERMKRIKDDPDRYCKERVWEEMDIYPNGEFDIDGCIKFAEKLTSKDLYEYYQTLFTENSLDIFVIGNTDEDKITDIIDNAIKGDFKKSRKEHYINRGANELKVITETSDTEQSKLAIGLRYEDLTDFERKYVSLVYNNILGGGWTSKLNRVVREENSLCYYVYATRRIPFGVSFIFAGIDASNYDKTIDLIKEQMKNMESFISEEELQRVKDVYYNALVSIEDSQSSILNNVMGMVFDDTDSISDRRKNMEKVTLDDVKRVAEKVKMEVIYLLEGGQGNGKENL